ncbi:glycosyltransferase family 2 protein [Chloroflexi bacterium TSY]|nr:glycosyltransferase family 2 protein [Chloroflexi bacterium TSY]
MNLGVILLNWNACNDTVRAIEQFDQWREIRPQIWVVDNASKNDEASLIEQACPQVDVIRSFVNLGFSAGTNLGIRTALSANQSSSNYYILLLNNDVLIDEAAVAQLLKTARSNPQVGLIGPVLYSDRERTKVAAVGGRNPVLYHHTHNTLIPSKKTIIDVDYVIGAAALVRSELFQTVGLLDEAYFFSAELADFCRRAQQQGYRCVVDLGAMAIHNLNRSSSYRTSLYPYYVIRNRFIFMRKFYLLLRIPLYLFWGAYSALLYLKLRLSGQSQFARSVGLGLWDGLLGRVGGQNERVLRSS